MTKKVRAKRELINLLIKRNASVKILNDSIKEMNLCNNHDDMVKVYNKYDELTK